jgi:hypothetical protein
LGAGADVDALHGLGNDLFLNGRGRGEAQFIQALHHKRVEIELVEFH